VLLFEGHRHESRNYQIQCLDFFIFLDEDFAILQRAKLPLVFDGYELGRSKAGKEAELDIEIILSPVQGRDVVPHGGHEEPTINSKMQQAPHEVAV
jgi:hypothetical protein